MDRRTSNQKGDGSMNDLAPVYKAVGSILKEQRAEIDLAIANQAEKLNDLLETLRVLDSSHAKRADGLRQRITAQAETAAVMLQKLEAKLAALPQAPAPYDDTDLRVELEAKLKELRSDLLEAQTGAVSGSAEELREQIKSLEAKLAALPPAPTPYDDTGLRVELEAKLKELRSDLLEAQTGAVSGSAEELREQIKSLEAKLAALPPAPTPYDDTEVCQRLDELTESVLELYQQPEVHKELRGGLDALRTQVDTMPSVLDERRAKAETELRHSLELLELRISKQLVELERKPGPKGKDGIGLPGRDGLGVDLKTWSPGVFREGEVVQYAIGKIARAKRDTVTKPDNRTDWERVGTAGFELKGVKHVDAEYEDGDLYMDDGTMFCWYKGKGRMFARRGRDGKDGKDAKKPRDGIDGQHGPKPLEIRGYADGFSLVYDDGSVVDFPVDQFKLFMDAWDEQRREQADGIVVSTFRSDWRLKNSYRKGDIVSNNGVAWIATKPVPENTQFSADHWARFSGGGVSGAGKVLATKTLFSMGDVTDITVSPVSFQDRVGIANLVGNGTLTIEPAGVGEYAVYLLRLTSSADGMYELTVKHTRVSWSDGVSVPIAPRTGQAVNLLIKSIAGEIVLSVTCDEVPV
jgi:hypothetical protein